MLYFHLVFCVYYITLDIYLFIKLSFLFMYCLSTFSTSRNMTSERHSNSNVLQSIYTGRTCLGSCALDRFHPSYNMISRLTFMFTEYVSDDHTWDKNNTLIQATVLMMNFFDTIMSQQSNHMHWLASLTT